MAEAANSLLVEMGYDARPGDPLPGRASPTGTDEEDELLSAQAYAECKDDVDYVPPDDMPGSEELTGLEESERSRSAARALAAAMDRPC